MSDRKSPGCSTLIVITALGAMLYAFFRPDPPPAGFSQFKDASKNLPPGDHPVEPYPVRIQATDRKTDKPIFGLWPGLTTEVLYRGRSYVNVRKMVATTSFKCKIDPVAQVLVIYGQNRWSMYELRFSGESRTVRLVSYFSPFASLVGVDAPGPVRYGGEALMKMLLHLDEEFTMGQPVLWSPFGEPMLPTRMLAALHGLDYSRDVRLETTPKGPVIRVFFEGVHPAAADPVERDTLRVSDAWLKQIQG